MTCCIGIDCSNLKQPSEKRNVRGRLASSYLKDALNSSSEGLGHSKSWSYNLHIDTQITLQGNHGKPETSRADPEERYLPE